LTAQTDSLGHVNGYIYDENGFYSSHTDKLGNVTTFEWHPTLHKLTGKTDALGRKWSYEWCTRGNLKKKVDPAGNETTYTYDAHNNRTSKTDPLGHTTRYVYDSTGNYLLQTIDAMGGVSSFTYDARGNLLTSTDQLGRTTTFEYDIIDRLVKSTYPDGRFTQISYDEAGNIVSRVDNLGRITAYTYDANGKLLTTTRPDSTVLSHEYDAAGRKIRSTDALGRVTAYEYDALDNMVKVTYPDQTYQTYVYDTEKRLISNTDELGNVTAYEYDPMGRMLASIDPAGNRHENSYDAAGRKISQTNPKGRTTNYDYDVLNRVIKTTFPDLTTNTSSYDAVGNLLVSTNALNQQTVYEYDALNRRVKTTRADGAEFTTVFDAAGQVISEIDALGNTTAYGYDNSGRRTSLTNAAGNTWHYDYDNAGHLIKTTDPLGGITALAYDNMNRLISETDPLGRTTSYEYDAAGKRVARTDAMGRRSITAYDDRDRLTTEIDAGGRIVSYGYDAAGRKTRLTDGAGRNWRWVYDALGRVTAEIDPLGNQVKSSYDAVGNLTLKTNARAQATAYEYDLMNRLVKINYPDSTAATFAYDALGREILRSGTAETVEKAYDVAGNLISENFVNQNKGWSYGFDLMGNRIQAVSPENETFKYKYDNLYRLIELDTGKASEKINYTYDALGRNIEEKRVDSTTANSFDSAGQLLEMKHYRLVKCRKSGNFWKKGKRHKNVGPVREPPIEEIIALRSYSYDLAGNRINMIDENGKVTSYEYDNSNWLTKVVYPNADVVTYAYNNAGDRVSEQLNENPSVVYEYDAAGRLLSKGSETFSYDADGNMVTDAVATYTWNSDNRLVRVEKTSGGCKHKKDRRGHGFGHLKHGKDSVVYEEYAYLPQDWRRITRKTGKYQINRRGDSKIAPKEQTFVSIYDGDDESHEYLLNKSKFKFRGKRHSRRESLKLFREFVGGPNTDDIKHTRYNHLSLAMLKDGLGSTIALTGKEARPIARINYDAWGEFRYGDKLDKAPCKNEKFDDYLERLEGTRGFGRSNHNAHAFGKHFGSKLTPYLYTGRRYSETTSQYFNRNRYYSPALGRFTSKDPIGFNGGNNLYRYANNNPLIYVDPYGNIAGVLTYFTVKEILAGAAIVYINTPKGKENLRSFVNKVKAGANWSADKIKDAYHGITCQLLPYDAAQRIYLASQEGSSDNNPPLIDSSEAGQPDPDEDPDKDPDEWKKTSPSRPLEKMGHAQKHADEFRQIDSSLSNNDIARILEYVRRTGRVVPGAGQHGGQLLEKAVTIRGKNVVVRVFETVSKTIKTGYPLLK
jgi:RHS repeat-associated protein